MHTLTGHRAAVRALAYAPGPEPLLASAGDDHSVRLWNPASREELAVLNSPRGGLLSLAFAPSGKRLAAGGRAGSLHAWDVASRAPDPGHVLARGPVTALSFTADGRALLAGIRPSSPGPASDRLVCWNLDPLHPIQRVDWAGEVECAAFNPATDTFAVACPFRGVELWEVGRPRAEPAFWMPGRVRALAFSPGGGRLLAVAGGREVGVWDVEARAWRARCRGHRGDVLAVAFSPDGLGLLAGGMDRTIRLWETLTGRQLAAWDWKVGVVHALAYSSDGMTAAAAGEKPPVVVWDVDEG